MAQNAPTWLDLYDWRGRVAAMYEARADALRRGGDPQAVWERFRATKDSLFKQHPQSPLSVEQRQTFDGLRYFPYDAALAVAADLEALAEAPEAALEASGPHTMRFRPAARARCIMGDTPVTLTVYWIDVYGGGLFLPFRDATCGTETYGGGRYLHDTVKGSALLRLDEEPGTMGFHGGRVLLDFNYAYNPSCAYDARWVCPLAPNENRLPLPVRAGELAFAH